MNNQDYENDAKRKLSITDPYGNESSLEPEQCKVCNATCVYADETCRGSVDMMSDMHLCEKHKKERHGAPNNWYESVETDKDGPVERMLGAKNG